jgi:hypothetical protein
MTRMHCQDRARRILAEWNAGAAVGVREDRDIRSRDAAEQEKSELLEGIREGLSAGGTRRDVSLRFLRHLAAVRN